MADINCLAVADGDVFMTIRGNGDLPDVDTVLSREDAETLVRKLIRELVIWEEGLW